MRGFKTIISAGFLASALVLAGCGGGGESGPTAEEMAAMEAEKKAAEEMAARQVEQRNAIMGAVMTAQAAVDAVDNDASDDEVTAADNAVASVRNAIMAATDLEADDTAISDAEETLATLEKLLDARKEVRRLAMEAAEKDEADRKAEMEAAEKAEMEAAEAARKMAAKLYAAISLDSDGTTPGSQPPTSAAGNPLTSGSGFKKGAVAAAVNGWSGQHYSKAKNSAVSYSMMSAATKGDPFTSYVSGNSDLTAVATDSDDGKVGEYAITETGSPGDISLNGFTRTSGTHEYTLTANLERLMVSGTLEGVSGTYWCHPGSATKCSATVSGDDGSGITLGGGEWTFKPNNSADRVTETPGNTYAFGWWLDETSDAEVKVFTSATNAAGNALAAPTIPATHRGTATYNGSAAGKYALNHGVGGSNDSGHFTADATLSASFGTGASNAHEISGTIDGFMGADGMARDWSVALGTNALAAGGTVTPTPDDSGTETLDESMTTVWTIDGVDASAAGSWGGMFYGSDGGTPTHATGTFSAGYDNVGRMIGAFGAELDN